jgi:hypothetical protein
VAQPDEEEKEKKILVRIIPGADAARQKTFAASRLGVSRTDRAEPAGDTTIRTATTETATETTGQGKPCPYERNHNGNIGQLNGFPSWPVFAGPCHPQFMVGGEETTEETASPSNAGGFKRKSNGNKRRNNNTGDIYVAPTNGDNNGNAKRKTAFYYGGCKRRNRPT